MDYYTSNFVTGDGRGFTQARPVTEKEKVELWFIEPLRAMKGDDAFICLMILFPLIETIIRFELGIQDDQDATFSDNSKELHWFADFMGIKEELARPVWDSFRNGLIHRAMIKGTIGYDLNGERPGRPSTLDKEGRVLLHVWDFRDKVIEKLKQHHRKLWRAGKGLPAIYVKG